MTIRTRKFYRSSSGDVWSLAHDVEANRLFILHEPNNASGGKTTDIELAAFLARGGQAAEQQAIVNLITSLIDPLNDNDDVRG